MTARYDTGGVQDRAPRLAPEERISTDVAARGAFADIDPQVPGRLWSRWEWAGLAGWALVAGLQGWRLWRRARPFVDFEPGWDR